MSILEFSFHIMKAAFTEDDPLTTVIIERFLSISLIANFKTPN